MNLSIEQKNKLREKMLVFIEEIEELVKDKEIRLDIPLQTYFNEYGGLVLKIYKGGSIYYETNKTRAFVYKDYDLDNCMYSDLKKNQLYNADIMLDILKNKEMITIVVKRTIEKNNELLQEILG